MTSGKDSMSVAGRFRQSLASLRSRYGKDARQFVPRPYVLQYDAVRSRPPIMTINSSEIQFVYLTSSPFSGSTLFSFLANAHPQIATVGEMTGLVSSQDPGTYVCSCGEKIRECPFWKRVAGQMTARAFQFDPGRFDTRIRIGRGPRAQRLLSESLSSNVLEDLRHFALTRWPTQRRRLQYLLSRNLALAASILQVTGKELFFDASKNPMAIHHYIREPTVKLRVVHLVRDVRGASLSRRKNRGETSWNRTVRAWVRMNRNIDRQLQRLPADRWMRIRYEDLCRTPEETMNRFFQFCGVEPYSIPADFNAQVHHIVGNRMRLTNIGEIRLDDEWRRKLMPAEQAHASKIAGLLHARYGYPGMYASDLST